jgi:hypothetical protein
MEDLQSLMSCLDEISSKIPDGIYLEMADKMKRINDRLTGDRPLWEDPFYDTDTDAESDDDDSDSDYEAPPDRSGMTREAIEERQYARAIEIGRLKDQLRNYVNKMHDENKVLVKWEKRANSIWTPIKRMTASRKSRAIKAWCEKNTHRAPGGDAGELIGHISTTATDSKSWSWKNLVEHGLRTIVLEIGTEGEIIRAQRGIVYYDELSLKTLQELPTFEKKIYDEYKEECKRKWNEYIVDARSKLAEVWGKMDRWEVLCREVEVRLRQLEAPIRERDYWDPEEALFMYD